MAKKRPQAKAVEFNSAGITSTLQDFMSQDPDKIQRLPRRKDRPKEESLKWWLAKEDVIGQNIESIIGRIENSQMSKRQNFVKFARFYGNWEALGWSSNSMLSRNSEATTNHLRLNVIQSVIDACAAKIAKDQPKPYFITSTDDYFVKLRAEKLTKLVMGVFQQTNFYKKAVSSFRDAEVYGTGGIKWFVHDGRLDCDWIFIGDIKVDEYDGMKQHPRSLHLVEMMNKEVVVARHPTNADEIEKIPYWNPVDLRQTQSVVEMVRIKHSWHLPSSEDSEDGTYACTIGQLCLEKQEYKKDYFPAAFIRWMTKPLGFFGRSITEEVLSLQIEINKFLVTAQQCFELIGIPLIFVPVGAEISEDVLLSNFIARMVPYNGTTPPQIVCPEPLPEQFFTHLNSLIQWVFQIVGLSQATASSMIQLGPNASGAAIREMVDIETTRFVQVGKAYEDFIIENAKIVVDMMKDLVLKDPTLQVTYTEKKILNNIKFKDVDIKDTFEIRCDAVSQLPDSVAGRIQTVGEYVDRNWISQEKAMELMQLDPDLENEINIQTSSVRLCEQRLSAMVEDGDIFKPEPQMNLRQALDISVGVYNMLVHDKCPENRLQIVRDWCDAIVAMMQDPMAQVFQPQLQSQPGLGQAPAAGAPQPQMGSAQTQAAPTLQQ